MRDHAAALALFDDFAAAGCPLVPGATGFGPALNDPPAALDAALQAFVGPGGQWAGLAPRRALTAVVRAQNRAARELLAWPVAFARLEEPWTAELTRKGAGVVITTHGATWYARVDKQPCFVARELDAIVLSVAGGRGLPDELDAWLAAKQRAPRWVLAPDPAMQRQGGTPDPALTFGELFDRLGAELVRVVVHPRLQVAQGAA